MIRIDVLTLFPEMIREAVSYSIMGRAREAGLAEVRAVNIRDFATDRHHTTDDTPCGGGGGMILKPEPIAAALESLSSPKSESALLPKVENRNARVILTDPQGERFTQNKACELAREPHLVFLCGHYEGVDERVRAHMVTDELSIGDYVLTGGELPALVMIDAIVRLIPGALGEEGAPEKDTFSEGLLEHPQYTRPRAFKGWEVPEILFSGHHAQIEKWRKWHRLNRTRERRPDLWAEYELSKEDEKLLAGGEPELPVNT